MSKLTKAQTAALTKAYGNLVAFTEDPSDMSLCAVAPPVREAARLYLQSWVMPAIAAVLIDADPELAFAVGSDRPEDYVEYLRTDPRAKTYALAGLDRAARVPRSV